jgi:selenocysteine lyase/cysteine desulfurase
MTARDAIMDSSLVNKYRDLVVGVDTMVPVSSGGRVTAVNFDNAATTPPFNCVLQDILSFAPWYSSIHRGEGFKSQISSMLYENSRMEILRFVDANPAYNTVIYVKNTTEAINKLAYKLQVPDRKCIILSSGMEHHSNDLPWRDKYNVKYIEIDKCGCLMLEDLEKKLKQYGEEVKLVALTGASNVTGYINPIYEAAKLAHQYGTRILVDGAQLIPHCPFSMKDDKDPKHIDFLAFSAHKMYAPFGTGVLIGPDDTFSSGPPDYSGGGTVDVVTTNFVKWNETPHRDEAGTPNLMGVTALISSVRKLKDIGMENVKTYEDTLLNYALKRLNSIKDVRLYCSEGEYRRVSIIPFNIEGVYHRAVARALSYDYGIAVRNGCFCAQPYIQKLLNVTPEEMAVYISGQSGGKRPGMVRLSFGIYNTKQEIDRLAEALSQICANKQLCMDKYME